jgi:hypothetical protein
MLLTASVEPRGGAAAAFVRFEQNQSAGAPKACAYFRNDVPAAMGSR